MSQTLPLVCVAARRLRLMLLALALSLVAAVLGMHGLNVGVAGRPIGSMAAMANLPAPLGAPDPGHPAGHDGPSAAGHHGCVAAQTAASPSLAAPTAHLTATASADVARHGLLTATSDVRRAPSDLNDLCVSRT